jgi:YebC/PmpR family DNA-binding regulatory protein
MLRDVYDLVHRTIEGPLVDRCRFGRSADLAHVLKSSGLRFVLVGGRLEIMEGVDVSAQAARPGGAAHPVKPVMVRSVVLARMFSMSGHSKWATTKHQKAIKDSRRAKSFAKLIKNIEVAAKLGGADLSGNPTLVDAIQKAKKTSVPNSNIDSAVKRGSGQLGEAVDYQTIIYEGYAAGGVALLIECLTDNRNRAAANVRTVMTRNGGTMGDPGSVAYNFSRKGVISVTKIDGMDEDDILGAVLDAGAEEVNDRGAGFEIVTEPHDLVAARTALQDAGIDYDSADVEFVPGLTIEVDLETAKKIFRLIDALDDDDDVQNVYGNFEVPADVQALLDEEE